MTRGADCTLGDCRIHPIPALGTATDIIEANRTRGPVAKSQIGACELMSLYRDSQHLEDVQITDRLSNSIQQFEVYVLLYFT